MLYTMRLSCSLVIFVILLLWMFWYCFVLFALCLSNRRCTYVHNFRGIPKIMSLIFCYDKTFAECISVYFAFIELEIFINSVSQILSICVYFVIYFGMVILTICFRLTHWCSQSVYFKTVNLRLKLSLAKQRLNIHWSVLSIPNEKRWNKNCENVMRSGPYSFICLYWKAFSKFRTYIKYLMNVMHFRMPVRKFSSFVRCHVDIEYPVSSFPSISWNRNLKPHVVLNGFKLKKPQNATDEITTILNFLMQNQWI